MLRLKNITKDYKVGDDVVHALRGISVRFRRNEFVAILGPSGCGKTTLLNIIGGLDRYTEGDLFIAGRSTKEFRDADWDAYRNHSVGFVFQSYNLIPHQSVLSNVELALTLSGVPKAERRARAKAALERVGLGDQLKKKPSQLSGGQMQRVAIARAIVNDPEILLADEPTGALDSETSVQIMEILKEISGDRLVIMVTHNPDLAERYATRTVGLFDGKIVSDTNPYEPAGEEPAASLSREKTGAGKTGKETAPKKKAPRKKKVSMSFWTALSLSLNNLMTKKGRTFLTSFAGSIGIIGIALILSLSNGINSYIESIQEETLASYPIRLLAEETDASSLLGSMTGTKDDGKEHGKDAVYSSSVMYEMINSMINAEKKTNDLAAFKRWLETDEDVQQYLKTVQYSYDVEMKFYARDLDTGKYSDAEVEKLLSNISGADSAFTGLVSNFSGFTVFEELLPGKTGETGDGALVSEMIREQYDLVDGAWPSDKSELLLVLDENNEITDVTQYSLGLVGTEEMTDVAMAAVHGNPIDIKDKSWSYEDIRNIRLKLILPSDLYRDEDGDGVYEDVSEDEVMMDMILSNAPELRISGIVRPKEDTTSPILRGSIGYTTALTEYAIEQTAASAIVQKQTDPDSENYDVFTGLPFYIPEEDQPSDSEKVARFREYAASLDDAGKADLYLQILSNPPEEEIEAKMDEYLSAYPDRATREDYIVEQYTAATDYSEQTIREFLAGYSDEELDTAIRDGLRQMLLAQYSNQASSALFAIASTPNEEELAQLTAPILAGLRTREQKVAYLTAAWTERTGMDTAVVAGYVAALSDEELDAKVTALANETASSQYASYAAAWRSSAQGLPDAQDVILPGSGGGADTGAPEAANPASDSTASHPADAPDDAVTVTPEDTGTSGAGGAIAGSTTDGLPGGDASGYPGDIDSGIPGEAPGFDPGDTPVSTSGDLPAYDGATDPGGSVDGGEIFPDESTSNDNTGSAGTGDMPAGELPADGTITDYAANGALPPSGASDDIPTGAPTEGNAALGGMAGAGEIPLSFAEGANRKIAAAWEEYLSGCDEATLARYYDDFMPNVVSDSTLQDNYKKLGVANLDEPSSISIYAASFEDKDAISQAIERYNESAPEEEQISYTDYVALLMSSVTQIVDFVSYGLIAFVSISLVVSSIMIGIITYISVLERTKEIGILRSIGASKGNIRTVFNAETLIIGFTSGVLGILATLLLCIPINAILHHLTGIDSIAVLPWAAAVILVGISMVLTLISGLIPASVASKKDPVIALRTD